MVNRREHNPVDALELMRQAVEQSPENREYRLDLAELYCEMGCHEQSSRLLLDMLVQKDAPAECYYGLALNQMGLNDLEGARRSLRMYRKADPDGALANSVGQLTAWFMQFIGVGFGIMLVIKGEILIGTVIAAQSFASDLALPIQNIIININSIRSVRNIVKKLETLANEYSTQEPKYTDSEKTVAVNKDHKYDVEFENVSLVLDNKTIVDSFSHTFESGKKYLVVVMSARGTVTADGLSVKTFGSFEETRALLDVGFKEYAFRQVLGAGQVLQQFPVTDGENLVYVGPAKDLYSTLPVTVQPQDVTFRCVLTAQPAAPLQKDQVIGRAEVWYREICVGTTDLVALHEVKSEGSAMQTLTPNAEPVEDQSLHNWLIVGGLVLAAVLFVAGIVVVVMILIRKRQMDRRHRLINEGVDR
jgi:tetratricopeptide (TPR) repeat protein